MFLPPVSGSAYRLPERPAGLRAIGAATAVEAVVRREPQQEFGPDTQRRLEQLRSRDRELRLQERAQVLLAGTLVRTLPSYTYERGPDGAFYAVDGIATVDTSGRGMLDPALARRSDPPSGAAPPAAGPGVSANPARGSPLQIVASPAAGVHRLDDGFAAAAARFYLTSTDPGLHGPIVDLFA